MMRTKHLEVRRGESVTLVCQADGDQPLQVTWRTKNNKIDPTYDHRYIEKTSSMSKGVISELRFIQSSLSDRGEYMCIASNAFGNDEGVVFLHVQEPPQSPRNLYLTELNSRSVILGWAAPITDDQERPFQDAQPITDYVVQFKKADESWNDNNGQKLMCNKTVVLVQNLRPATTYQFRVFARNNAGSSPTSDVLDTVTDEEMPDGPPKNVTVEPLSSQELKVTWRPPEYDLWNGVILGYKVGYRRIDGTDKKHNYTLTVTAGGGGSGGVNEHTLRLTGLDKYTAYSIMVKLFNGKGDGPASEPVVTKTLEDGKIVSSILFF